ncbi:hypothetical protein DL769_001572 [Monosporascus sp. CRB-8-3]|nr:hypothetical protein DL769_001572 [Monosporascus sp. CRB-8-3]
MRQVLSSEIDADRPHTAPTAPADEHPHGPVPRGVRGGPPARSTRNIAAATTGLWLAPCRHRPARIRKEARPRPSCDSPGPGPASSVPALAPRPAVSGSPRAVEGGWYALLWLWGEHVAQETGEHGPSMRWSWYPVPVPVECRRATIAPVPGTYGLCGVGWTGEWIVFPDILVWAPLYTFERPASVLTCQDPSA